MDSPLPDTIKTIQQKYAEHSALVAELATLDYIPQAYQTNEQRVKDLQDEIAVKKNNVRELEAKTQTEQKDVDELKRSRSKRFYLRLTEGREGLEKKKLKEEQEYVDALNAEQNEKFAISRIEKELANAKAAHEDLQKKLDHRTLVRRKLDALYRDLFSGSTEEYPEEDLAEKACELAEEDYSKIQEKLNHESMVNSRLERAYTAMAKCLERMAKAEDENLKELAARNQMYELAELADLKHAKRRAIEAETYYNEAVRIDPNLPDLGNITVPLQDTGISASFASYEGQIQVHRLFSEANKVAYEYNTRLKLLIADSRKSLQAVTQDAVEKSNTLSVKRRELEAIRRRIFEDVHKGIVPLSPPTSPHSFSSFPTFPMAPISFPEGPPLSFSTDSDLSQPGGFRTPVPAVPPQGSGYPAGGFLSKSGAIQVTGSVYSEQASPAFPNTPAYAHPSVDSQTAPGFRGAGELGIATSIAAVAFPQAVPWALNPHAAAILLDAGAESPDEDKKTDADMKMPGGPPLGLDIPAVPQVKVPTSPTTAGLSSNFPTDDKWPTALLKEKEELLHLSRGKLFRFVADAATPRWDITASGTIALVRNNETHMVRIIIRDDKTGQVATEHELTTEMRLLPSVGSDRSFVWNVLAGETAALRFKDQDTAKAFQVAFEDALVPLSGLSPTDYAAPPMPTPQSSHDSTAPSMPSLPSDPPGYSENAIPGWPQSPSDLKQDSFQAGPSMPQWPQDVKKPSEDDITVQISALNINPKSPPPSATDPPAPALPPNKPSSPSPKSS